MNTSNACKIACLSATASLIAACGGGSGGTTPAAAPTAVATPQTGNMSLLVSDASTEDWATIGIKLLSIALVPQGGGANVTVYRSPSPAPTLNLAQLDQIAEILGSVAVPVGAYSGAVLTVSGNADDVLLTVAADPSAAFTTAAGATISTGQIQVQHTQGSAGTLIVPIDVSFAAPLVVNTTVSAALELEFDLAHPGFLVEHVSPAMGGTVWAVDFDAPVHQNPVYDLAHRVLRHTYGSVTAVATDNTAITVAKEFPTEPAVSPETAVGTAISLNVLADAINGTVFYDVDAGTSTVIKSFAAEASLPGKAVRIAARYQNDGTLVATRIWASSRFNSVWVSPEGHVLHVDAASGVIAVASEAGGAIALGIDANTEFYFNSSPIATGAQFLADHDLTRGFKVHTTVVDPLAVPLVAQSVDIESATYDGTISASGAIGFTYTRKFRTASDDYVVPLNYIGTTTVNGTDASGSTIDGFKWWNFAYPTVLDSGANAVSDFVAATSGLVNFGGSVGAVTARGVSHAVWNDPANPNGWSVSASVLAPSSLPLGVVASGLVGNAFTMTIRGGSAAVTVAVGTAAGSATLVYRVDRTGGVVTVSPVDVTTSTGLTALTQGLGADAPVKVYGIPQADATLKAYILTYFTGDMPAQ